MQYKIKLKKLKCFYYYFFLWENPIAEYLEALDLLE